MSRESIHREVDGERDHQDEKYGGPEHDDQHLPNDWIAMVARYGGGAAAYPTCSKTLTPADRRRFRKGMIQVAGIAFAAIESVDRLRALEPPHECDGTRRDGARVTGVGACWYCGEQVTP
jgi:hypothetical protein